MINIHAVQTDVKSAGAGEGIETPRRVRSIGRALPRSSPPLHDVRHHARTADTLQALQTSQRRDQCLGRHLEDTTRQGEEWGGRKAGKK